ncbi:hypothetical protein BDV40DRAFT_268489 [Aspergillus tamarii]|uniref:Uncharacterized protein n=1 Tax=Aspergillus tamarii TaxID=41984 RepID=A0A5N6URI4_ASPTM|nr:hypothetical protein BDV40DRAFT_268489 [Aspergillus tamarii]
MLEDLQIAYLSFPGGMCFCFTFILRFGLLFIDLLCLFSGPCLSLNCFFELRCMVWCGS